MRKFVLSSLLIFAAFYFAFAQTPVLGSYSPAVVTTAGANATVIPSTAPTNTISITANTSANFKGLLYANPATGIVTITNAHPAGTYTITIKAFNGAFATTNSFNLSVGNPVCGNPGSPVSMATGDNSFSVVVNDFNNDGKQDFIITNYPGPGTVAIRFGDGAGGFTGTTSLSVGSYPRSVVTGDFNGDGNADFATVNSNSATISVRLGNGAGGFTAAPDVITGNSPTGMAIGDFNGDGIPDLAIAIFGGNVVAIRLGNGAGNFSGTTDVPTGTYPEAITVGDFNGDGKPDFAVINYGGNNVSVRLNNGNGGFINAPNINLGATPNAIATGDFNKDGKTDLLIQVANYMVAVRLGDGFGNFTGNMNVATGAEAYTLAVGDYNGDGTSDFVTPNVLTNSIRIWFNNGTGSFTGGSIVGLLTPPRAIAIGDFNADGRPDLIVTRDGSSGAVSLIGSNNEISLFGNNTIINDGSSMPLLANHTDFGNAYQAVRRIYTIKNTGPSNLTLSSIMVSGTDAAMFTTSGITLPATVLNGDSVKFTVSFLPATAGVKTATITVGNDDCDEAIYDFAVRGTGVLPVLGTYAAATVNTVGGNTTITPSAPPANAVKITASTTARFKGILQVDSVTGKLIITNAHPAGTYKIRLQASSGLLQVTDSVMLTVNNAACSQAQFSGSINFFVGNNPKGLAVGDFNADGNQDLVTTNYSGNSVTVNLGNGAGGFSNGFYLPVGNSPVSVVVKDFNGDGKQDFAVANFNSDNISICAGNGAGAFTVINTVPAGSVPIMLVSGDFNGDGKADLMTTNAGTTTVSIRLGDGQGNFSGTSNFATGSNSQLVAIADFNNDGREDFAIAHYSNNTLGIFTGNGNGTFSGPLTLPVGGSPIAIATDDFNGDGNADIAVVNNSSNDISIRLGNGTGGFTAVANVSAIGTYPQAIAVGDFNGDGKPDLSIIGYDANTGYLTLGDGTGNFIAASSINAGILPRGIAVADFNNDGVQDLAFSNFNQSNTASTVTVRFGGAAEINIQGNSSDIAAGSLSPTLANHTDFGNVSSSFSRTFTIQNTGNTTLTVSKIVVSGADSSLFTITNSSLPAIIAAGSSIAFKATFVPLSTGLKTAVISVMNNDCDEALYSFAVQGAGVAITPTLGMYPATIIMAAGGNKVVTPTTFPVNTAGITATASADFKGLLHVDSATGKIIITNAHPAGTYLVTVRAQGIISATSTFQLTVNNTACSQGKFIKGDDAFAGQEARHIAIGDFNNDGKQDLLSSSQYLNFASISFGNGAGKFLDTATLNMGVAINSLTIADFNSDGKQDFAAANSAGNAVSIRFGNGTGKFLSGTSIPVGASPRAVVVADFNGDGKVDFATPNTGSNTLSIRLGNGAGGFNFAPDVAVELLPFSIAVADFNGDGKTDLASTNRSNALVSIRLGDGTGGFINAANVVVGDSMHTVVAGDFNNDGKQDLAITKYNTNSISIRLGDGTGNFMGNTTVAVGGSPGAMVTGDFNGDGNADIGVVNSQTNNISIRFGDGTGNFTGTTNLAVSPSPQSIAVGDFNNDGKQDLASPASTFSTTSIFLGSDNEIDLKGNRVSIANGDSIPDIADYTSFGNVPVNSNLTRRFTIYNTGSDTLLITAIHLSGADSVLFSRSNITLPARLAATDSISFNIVFAPTNSGSKTTRVIISNNDCDESDYVYAIKGSATVTPGINPNVWLGNTADWSLAGNWSLGFVPLENTRVIVNAGTPFMPEVTSPASACYSLSLNNGATITIKTGGYLKIAASN